MPKDVNGRVEWNTEKQKWVVLLRKTGDVVGQAVALAHELGHSEQGVEWIKFLAGVPNLSEEFTNTFLLQAAGGLTLQRQIEKGEAGKKFILEAFVDKEMPAFEQEWKVFKELRDLKFKTKVMEEFEKVKDTPEARRKVVLNSQTIKDLVKKEFIDKHKVRTVKEVEELLKPILARLEALITKHGEKKVLQYFMQGSIIPKKK